MPGPHTPNRLRNYVRTHDNWMEQLRRRGFIHEDTLTIERINEDAFLMQGEIACMGDIVVSVLEQIDVVEHDELNPLVHTVLHAYNAHVRGHDAFLRHDNQHEGWLYPGHGDPHHVHVLDWRTGDEKPGSPFWCGQEGWPTLGEFIQKVELWYYDNLPQLPNPYRVAELGLRG